MFNPQLLNFRHSVVGKLLKDAIIAGVVRFRQVASSNNAAKSEGVKLTLDGDIRSQEMIQGSSNSNRSNTETLPSFEAAMIERSSRFVGISSITITSSIRF